jgi:hypothetical protein
MEAESSSSVAACCVEPLASACAPSAIWFEPVVTCEVATLISLNMLFKFSTIFVSEIPIVSLSESVFTFTVKSPLAI